jgi:hypothetical protein
MISTYMHKYTKTIMPKLMKIIHHPLNYSTRFMPTIVEPHYDKCVIWVMRHATSYYGTTNSQSQMFDYCNEIVI